MMCDRWHGILSAFSSALRLPTLSALVVLSSCRLVLSSSGPLLSYTFVLIFALMWNLAMGARQFALQGGFRLMTHPTTR